MIRGQFDPRSLALFRIALGLLVFSQTIVSARDFSVFFRPDGAWSIATGAPFRSLFLSPDALSSTLHLIIVGLLPAFAVALIVGFVTRIATLVCFVSLIVVQDANPDILQGGDVLLRLLLFWSLFLPLGETWSIDSRVKWVSRLVLPWTTVFATWALTLQVCFVYWFAALLKMDPLWIQSGNALFFALNIEHFTTPFGLYLRQYPDLLRVLTFGTIFLEFAGPCLLLISWRREKLRFIIVILFVGFHLIGMQSLLRIGLFPWVCATAWLIFIPGLVWNTLGRKDSTLASTTHKKGKIKKGAPPDQPAEQNRVWTLFDYSCSALVVAGFVDILAWNIVSLRGTYARQWMNQYDVFGTTLRLDQRWNMYAPFPTRDHGWIVVPADLADGTEIDLFNDKPVSWEKPADIGEYFGDDRWRRYLSNLFDDQNPEALQSYADYLVRRWNQHHKPEEKVETVTIYYMKQATQPDLTITSPEKTAIFFRSY